MSLQNGIKSRNFLTTSVRTIDEENLRISHVVNTKTLDRYGTVVLPRGVIRNHFEKNPVVLWLHNTDKTMVQVPIGRCIEMSVTDNEIVCTTEFNRNDPFAVKVFNAYRDGFMNAWSIGFMPMKWKRFDEENLQDLNLKYGLNITKEQVQEAGAWGLYLIYEWELLEYSAVPVPGNPEALSDSDVEKFSRELVTRGLVDEAVASHIDFRSMLQKKDEEATKVENDDKSYHCDCSEGKDKCDCDGKNKKAEEKSAETEAQIEAQPEGELKTEKAPEETPKVEESKTEAAPVENQPEASTVSTSDKEKESAEAVAEESKNNELVELKAQIAELTQKNFDLSERMAKLEARLLESESGKQELEAVKVELAAVKKSVEVDNIETVRKVSQKKAKETGSENFFSNLVGKRK